MAAVQSRGHLLLFYDWGAEVFGAHLKEFTFHHFFAEPIFGLNMNGFHTYQETAVTTQNRGRLIVMLYDGAIKFLRQAIEDLRQNDFAAKGNHIARAQDILFELNTVLDMEKGGQIAENLRALYAFMQKHLSQANIRKDPQMIQEVINMLEELNRSWRAVTN